MQVQQLREQHPLPTTPAQQLLQLLQLELDQRYLRWGAGL
jgi:hypothetical protein